MYALSLQITCHGLKYWHLSYHIRWLQRVLSYDNMIKYYDSIEILSINFFSYGPKYLITRLIHFCSYVCQDDTGREVIILLALGQLNVNLQAFCNAAQESFETSALKWAEFISRRLRRIRGWCVLWCSVDSSASPCGNRRS